MNRGTNLKKIIAALLCITLIISFFPAMVTAGEGGGSLKFFFVDNIAGELSFDYSNSVASVADVNIVNLSQDLNVYSGSHVLTNGTLSLSDLSLSGQGNFRLTITANGDKVTRDFIFLRSEYVESFPEVTKEDVLTKLSAINSDSHPYLFANASHFKELAVKIHSGTDYYLTRSYSEIKEYAAKIRDGSVSHFDITVNSSYISRGFESWQNVMFSAFVYLMDKDTDPAEAEKYAQRAYAEAEYLCNKETWGENQYIDNNQLAFAVALCYDWLYDWLDDTQKAVLTNGLKTLHLNTVKDLLENGEPQPGSKYYTTFYRFYFAGNNHAVLDNSSTVIEALAIADIDADYSASIIAKAMNNLQNPLSRLAPDSVWFEGAGYWTFVGPFVARMIDALNSSIGTDFGYSNLPVIKNMGYFPIYQQSYQGSFVFCDAGDSLVSSPEIFWFAQLVDDLGMQSYALSTSPADPLLCLWYDPSVAYGETNSFQKDMLYRNGDTVTMRSGWHDTALFAGMSVNAHDSDSTAGLYQNSGTFVIDALGEQWIKNPGRDSYRLDEYEVPHNSSNDKRWKYYCTRAEANSCVVINPDQYGGQNLLFGDTISGFDASADEAFAYASLSGAYRDNVNSYNRGIKLFEGRTRVLVKDEISLKQASDVYSFLSVYRSHIEILPDGSSAILSKGDKKMLVKIKANAPFVLSKEQAVQKFSQRQAGERDWTVDYDRLALHFTNATNLNISMIFAPFYGNEVPSVTFDEASINNWTATDDDTPRLSELRIDGVPVADFDPAVNYHKLYADSFSPAVTASSDDGSVAIRRSGSDYDITVTSQQGKANTYRITIATLATIEADTYVSPGWPYAVRNYGSSEFVTLKGHGTNGISSNFAYYKIDIGDIPNDMKLKSISLELNGRYFTDSSDMFRRFSFYLTDYNEWDENEVACATAPVNLAYATSSQPDSIYGYPPKGYDAATKTYTQISADAWGQHTFAQRFPLSMYDDAAQPAWRKEIIDITPVYEAGDKSDKLAFVITPESILTQYQADFASKEHSDESLRPRVLIELEPKASVAHLKLITNSDYTAGYSYANAPRVNMAAHGDTLRAVSSVSGSEGTMYVAQYDEDGTLLSVISVPVTAINANPVSDAITVLADAAQIKAFVWDSSSNPATTSETVTISQ